MTIGERFKEWIDVTASGFADRLTTWTAHIIVTGSIKVLDELEQQAIPEKRDQFVGITLPPEIKEQLDALTGSEKAIHIPAWILLALGAIVGSLLGAVMGWAAPIARATGYKGDWFIRSARLDPITAIRARWRGIITDEHLETTLKELGWPDRDIEAIKDVTKFYPAPADLIRWQAREVFEPEMIERYGLDDEFGLIEKEPFYKAGMTDEQILNYWRAHWEHASWMQVVEMLHRGLLTEEQVWDWFRVVEIPPFWRDKLIDSAYTWPTRVDVRRWWDMRTIDETELRRLYSGMGYRGVNLDNYVLWTKVYVAFPDLMARWTKGWITIDDVRAELTGLGMPAERLEEMIQMKITPQEPERVEEGKALTKTEIYKGVKKELITWEEGIELLMDLGYDYEEADYILTINVGVLEGSPETFAEFKDITQKYRIATGREEKPMPEELKAAAFEVVRVTREVESLKVSIKEEEAKLIELEPRPEEAEARLKGLQLARNRAIAELSRVKLEYDRQLAEWKHVIP